MLYAKRMLTHSLIGDGRGQSTSLSLIRREGLSRGLYSDCENFSKGLLRVLLVTPDERDDGYGGDTGEGCGAGHGGAGGGAGLGRGAGAGPL